MKTVSWKTLMVLFLIVLLAPVLPAGAVAIVEMASEAADASGALPFDPQQVVQQARNAFHEAAGGFYSDNGYRRAELDAWGLTFIPYVGDSVRRDYALGFRLDQIQVGQETLYSAPQEGGSAPALSEAGVVIYQRPGGIREEYYSLDFALEQIFVLPQALTQTGKLVFSGLLSTTLTPEQSGGNIRFFLGDDAVLSFGEALVRDADGQELGLELTLQNGQVNLAVPGDWLAGATYPVVVDPLIGSNIAIATDSDQQKTPVVAVSDVDLDDDDARRYLVVWTDDVYTGTDIFGYIVEPDGELHDDGEFTLTQGITATEPAIAYSTESDEWLVCWTEDPDGADEGDVDCKRVDATDGTVVDEDPIEVSDESSGDNALAPAVAVNEEDSDYRFLVTWTDNRNDSLGDIRARIVTGGGSPGSAVWVDTTVDTAASASAVAYDPNGDSDGEWLVVYAENSVLDIHGQRVKYDASQVNGSQISICSASLTQSAPVVAYNDRDDEFLVTWEDNRNSLLTGWDVYGIRVANGSTTGSELSVNMGATNQRYPTLAYNANVNEYLVGWQEATTAVKVQQLSNDGEIMDGLYTVSGTGSDTREYPAVAFNAERNEYLAVWQYQPAIGLNPDYDIYARRLDTTFEVDDDIRSGANSVVPDAAYNSTGETFLVVWDYNGNIYGQIISKTGVLSGTVFTIRDNSNTLTHPAVTYDDDNDRWLVLWKETDSGADEGIYGREVKGDGRLPTYNDFTVGDNASINEQRPALDYDTTGGKYFAVWQDATDTEVDGVLITPTATWNSLPDVGTVQDDIGGYDDGQPDVAANPDSGTNYRYLVVWQRTDLDPDEIKGKFIDSTGSPYGSVIDILSGATYHNYVYPAVAFQDTADEFLVIAKDTESNDRSLDGALVSNTGSVESTFQVSYKQAAGNVRTDLEVLNEQFQVVWGRHTDAQSDACEVGTTAPTSPPPDGYALFSVYWALQGNPRVACGENISRCLVVGRVVVSGDHQVYALFMFR
jgi:hypothetical protein